VPQFQIIFNKSRFQSVVPWLMLNPRVPRHSHPSADPRNGRRPVYALWLGAPIKLKLDAMQRRGYRIELLPTAEGTA
jgi:aromatic ring-cleaving dioxygenase